MTLADADAEALLAGLWLEHDDERCARLRDAAVSIENWDDVLLSAEAHGVLVLFQRNCAQAGVKMPPATVRRCAERKLALREDAQRVGVTLARTLRAANERGVDVTLLKGCSLALDLYPDPALRAQGDLDLLVTRHDLPAAVEAGAEAGVLPGRWSLPRWWYVLTHFHYKLKPTSNVLREVELHWSLHHASLLHTPRVTDLLARREEVAFEGNRAFTLDRLDRLLHLVTHLHGHAHGDIGAGGRDGMRAVAAEVRHPIRLKWVLDVHAEVEKRAAAMPVDDLVARTREWHAERQLGETLAWVRDGLGLHAPAAAWVDAVLAAMAFTPRGASRPVRRIRETGPLDVLDFRAHTLWRLPRWVFPPGSYIARRYGLPRALGLAARAWHAACVAALTVATAVALPAAVLTTPFLLRRRRDALARTKEPARVADLVTEYYARTKSR